MSLLIQSLGIHRDDRIDCREYLISPILGEKRLRPAPLSLSEITKLDIILVSHNHFDHLGMYKNKTSRNTSDINRGRVSSADRKFSEMVHSAGHEEMV